MSLPTSNKRDWFDELLRSTRGISDRPQRAIKILHGLQHRPSEEIAAFLRFLFDVSLKNPQAKLLHMDLLSKREVFRELSYEQISTIYEIAEENSWTDIQALFHMVSPRWSEDEIKPEGFAQKLSALTLGERKQLSRQMKRSNIEMLVFDEAHQVIEALLTNPKLRESDVVRLASRQGAPAKVLEEVCKSKRWNGHYPVRKALVFNSSTPLAYTLGFVRHLNRSDLKLLLETGGHRPELTKAARETLAKKKKL